MPTPGPLEIVILLVIVLLIFGPKRLPEIGGALGKGIREFKRGTNDKDVPETETRRISASDVEPEETASRPVPAAQDREAG